MNKAIADGLVLMPLPFASGRSVWSSGNGTPGSDTYAGSGGGVFVPADQDFGGCLGILKSASTRRLRYMGETTILPGRYLQVTARVKAVARALTAVRIAGFPANAQGNQVSSLTDRAVDAAHRLWGCGDRPRHHRHKPTDRRQQGLERGRLQPSGP